MEIGLKMGKFKSERFMYNKYDKITKENATNK